MIRATTEEDSYRELAVAIVGQAVEDYKRALRFMTGKGLTDKSKSLIERYNNDEKLTKREMEVYVYPYRRAEGTIIECERFFRSETMELYAPKIDGERVITELKRQFLSQSDIPSYYEDNK